MSSVDIIRGNPRTVIVALRLDSVAVTNLADADEITLVIISTRSNESVLSKKLSDVQISVDSPEVGSISTRLESLETTDLKPGNYRVSVQAEWFNVQDKIEWQISDCIKILSQDII